MRGRIKKGKIEGKMTGRLGQLAQKGEKLVPAGSWLDKRGPSQHTATKALKRAVVATHV